jgi:hypothetical protein
MAALLGDLVLVPWQRPYEVPTGKVLSAWRTAVGPAPLAGLQARLLAAAGAEHRDHDYRAVCVGDSGHELHPGSIDGSVTRVPDTPANREAFGSTGTADDSAPYPQVRDLLASDASARGALSVISGPSGGPKAEGEQALLDTMLTTCPQIFTPDRIWVMDRNFPGADRVARMLATGTHVLIRVKSDIALPQIGGFLPDGSYYSYLTGGPAAGRWCLKVRVIEYQVDVDGQDTGELFCLITDLCDHVSYPAAQLAAAYAWRWTGSETSLKEAKSAITGAGPSSGPIFRSAAPELITQEHAAWICGTELIRALARAAARQAAPARKGRLAGQKVQPRQISFTAARRAAMASIRSGAATASLPAPMTWAFHRDTLRALGKRRIVIDRHRHRDRKTKARQAFPGAGRGITTRTAIARVDVNKDEMATRHGAWGGAAVGALIGILFPPAIIGTAVVGAAVGGVSGALVARHVPGGCQGARGDHRRRAGRPADRRREQAGGGGGQGRAEGREARRQGTRHQLEGHRQGRPGSRRRSQLTSRPPAGHGHLAAQAGTPAPREDA